MWDDIELQRREDGSIPPSIRMRLLSKTDAECEQAVAFVLEQEIEAVLVGRDPDKKAEAQEALARLERLRELLRVRAYSVEVERVWRALQHEEQVRLIEHVDSLGAAPTEDSAKAVISLSITRMALATIVGVAERATGGRPSIGAAMAAAPITLELMSIRQAGDHHAAPGQALKIMGVRAKRSWFGRSSR